MYQILEDRSSLELMKKVRDWMQDGWRPIGGVAVAKSDTMSWSGTTFYQAMIQVDK